MAYEKHYEDRISDPVKKTHFQPKLVPQILIQIVASMSLDLEIVVSLSGNVKGSCVYRWEAKNQKETNSASRKGHVLLIPRKSLTLQQHGVARVILNCMKL